MKIVALILLSLSAAITAAFAEPSAASAAPAAPAAQAAKDAAAPSAPGKDAPAAGNSVRYANDKVTLDVRNMSAADLVDEIARQANAKVTGSVGNAAAVTANQRDVPLKVALEHMLGAQNFTLTYGEQGELRVIQLRGQQQQQKQGQASANGPADVSPNDKNRASASEMALFKAFDLPCQTEIPIDGAISRRLGRDKARLDLIANTTISDSDPNVRETGMKAMMKMFDGDQTLRAQVMTTTNGMTDAQLAAFARAYMYHWAENFVHGIKAESSDPDVRRRAGAVLRELRNNPYSGPIPPEASQPLPPA